MPPTFRGWSAAVLPMNWSSTGTPLGRGALSTVTLVPMPEVSPLLTTDTPVTAPSVSRPTIMEMVLWEPETSSFTA